MHNLDFADLTPVRIDSASNQYSLGASLPESEVPEIPERSGAGIGHGVEVCLWSLSSRGRSAGNSRACLGAEQYAKLQRK
jgi:hypothetical protein